MPRQFVNAISNFAIQGGIVSFTLQDQALRSQNGETTQAPPEEIANVVMREQDFMALLATMQNHVEQYRAHLARQQGGFDAGRKQQQPTRLGGAPALPGGNQVPMGGPMVQQPGAQPGSGATGLKIRPKAG